MRCLKLSIVNVLFFYVTVVLTEELTKDAVDNMIEDDITHKMTEDLLQSIDKKFQVDLQKSIDQVLVKIKGLLQNGTTLIQDKLIALQRELKDMNVQAKDNKEKLDACVAQHQDEAVELSEKALHQMVLCGYALIGHNPERALTKIMAMKQVITDGIKPLRLKGTEVFDLLKICGHDHDSLKKVVKCVISKSPLIKTAMMDITKQMLDGVFDLTKLLAHGAMHEACLIEVVKSIEDEAQELIDSIKFCAEDMNKDAEEKLHEFLAENNATMLELDKRKGHKVSKESPGTVEAPDASAGGD